MRILYGVQATGNGHITRARVMAKALAERNIQVDYLFSGRPRDKLFDMEPFGDFQCLPGLTFATHNGRVSIPKTLLQARLGKFLLDSSHLDLSGYDLVLNDFEPVSAWASWRQNVRCIGLSHQSAFRFDVPKVGQDLSSKMLMSLFAPASEHMGVHWHHFGNSILPPIIDVDMQRKTPESDKVVVYLPFESLQRVQNMLAEYPQVRFFVYHPDANNEDHGHIHLRALNRAHFEHDLVSAGGVIANGGFELPSESLYLGKKLLVKPLKGQFEQESNVATLAQMNLASVMQKLCNKTLQEWLERPNAEPVHFPNVSQALADWIAGGAKSCLNELAQQLWQRTEFPSYVALPES